MKSSYLEIFAQCSMFSGGRFEIYPELESQGYAACLAVSAEYRVLCRTAKVTPTKPGQFVTAWERGKSGSIEPYSELTAPDYFLIVCKNEDECGCFLFPQDVLLEQGIIASSARAGKCAFRVYPPESGELNATAKRTQKWQLAYFHWVGAISR